MQSRGWIRSVCRNVVAGFQRNLKNISGPPTKFGTPACVQHQVPRNNNDTLIK